MQHTYEGEGGGPGTPMPDFLINQNVTMPSRADLQEHQLAAMLQEPVSFNKDVPETQQEVDLLLDSNYAIISQLVRLRYSREAGKPLCVENKLMAMLEKNLAKLVACQPPSALISSRTAQATRSMLGSTKETEPGHAPAATQQPLLQGGVMQQSAMQMMPNQTGIGDVTIQQGAIGPGMMQGQPQQHQLHQQQQQQALAQQQQQQLQQQQQQQQLGIQQSTPYGVGGGGSSSGIF